ncbi:hypothetical protein PHYBOEH_005996 [Phytophthora boehmeriae]|uniref:M96 mating-specific protein family n=1 Tax=Phytophthora boehmeriae TaxID=109152 RepID=A0A8T1WPC7_9STRA|nr:hypothetical protein PHYBOEH_005996 [Phytophthora boehmeriae]
MDELDLQDLSSEPVAKKLKRSEHSSVLVTPRPTHATTPKELPRKRRNTSWLRRKQEIQSLRGETETLEARLAYLHKNSVDGKVQPTEEVATESLELWKSVAAIARQGCQAAQDENTRLKHDLQVYSNAADLLHHRLIAANAQQQLVLERCAVFARAVRVGRVTKRSLQLTNNELFDVLEGKVNARLHELDTILRETRQTNPEGDAEHMRICRDDDYEAAASVEFEHVRLFPYAEDTTASSVWELIEVGGVLKKADVCTIRRSADVVAARSQFTLPLDANHTVSVDTSTIIKRIAVSIGLVVLVQSTSEWSIQHKTGSSWRHTTDEAGWVVVHEYSSASDGEAATRGSRLRSMVKLRPNDADQKGSTTPRSSFTGTVGDVVIPSFREILSSHHQSFENFLFDSARCSGKT